MNTSTVTITREEAIKYYKRGGTLRELALQAFPNIGDVIEEEKELQRKRDELNKQAKLDYISKRFPKGALFRCGDNLVYKIIGSPLFISKTRIALLVKTYNEDSYRNTTSFRECAIVFEFRKDDNVALSSNSRWAITHVRFPFFKQIDLSFASWWHFYERNIVCLSDDEARKFAVKKLDDEMRRNQERIRAIQEQNQEYGKRKELTFEIINNLIKSNTQE